MVAPLLCGAVIPGIGVLTAALLHKLWSLGDQLGPAEPVPAAPLHWQLEPPFLLLGLIILLDFIQKMLCRFKLNHLSAQITETRCQAVALRREAGRLSSPETFTQAAKLQRRAISADKAAQQLTNQQEAVKQSWTISAPRIVKRLAVTAFVVIHWGRPVLWVEPGLLWRFGWWFTTPHYRALAGTGAITAGPWVTLCQAASSLLGQAF